MFILRYTLFLKKGILAACNRNVNQRDNLPVRPWPAWPMLTQVSWDRKKKKKRSKMQTVQTVQTVHHSQGASPGSLFTLLYMLGITKCNCIQSQYIIPGH